MLAGPPVWPWYEGEDKNVDAYVELKATYFNQISPYIKIKDPKFFVYLN